MNLAYTSSTLSSESECNLLCNVSYPGDWTGQLYTVGKDRGEESDDALSSPLPLPLVLGVSVTCKAILGVCVVLSSTEEQERVSSWSVGSFYNSKSYSYLVVGSLPNGPVREARLPSRSQHHLVMH